MIVPSGHVTALTFSLGLLKLSASRFDVALHQNADHLLPVGQLRVFRAVTVGLKHTLNGNLARRVVHVVFQYNHVIVYHRCDWWVFILRMTAAAAAAELFKYSSRMVN